MAHITLDKIEIPKNWKPAGAGEEELAWILYDYEADGDAGNEELTFFNSEEATVDQTDTNMQTASQLPATQRFLIKWISVAFDTEVDANDVHDMLDKGSFELKIANKRLLVGPLGEFVGGPKFIPSGVTANVNYVHGEGYVLEKAITIPGGVPFKAIVTLGDTAASAALNISVRLHGRLVRPA